MNQIIDLRQSPSPRGPAVSDDETCAQSSRRAHDAHAIAFITCVNDETQYAICVRYIDALHVPPGYRLERIAVLGADSIAEGYQQGMEASTALYKIYLHQDLYLVHRDVLSDLLYLFKTYPRLGLIGVEGATRLPASVLYSVNNPFHCFGRHWTYRRPGGPSALLGPANRRRLHYNRFRSFVGDYLPAVVVDGFFMATQYDMSWTNPLGGFELYDDVRAVDFIKAGLEVGIARQLPTWVLHWGALQEPSRQQRIRRHRNLQDKVAAFRQLYGSFVGVRAPELYRQHQDASKWVGTDPAGGRLGVIVVTVPGGETLTRVLRALLPQCEALEGVTSRVVVINNAEAGGTKGVHEQFPQVAVLASPGTGGMARSLNEGLRHLGFPSYILVMHSSVELPPGTLASMVVSLRQHPSRAGVVASLVGPDGTVQPQRTAIVQLVPRRPRRPQQVTFMGTTCVLVRGEVFFDVGLYDERLSSGYEDIDWSLRAKRKGYVFTYLPDARAIHHHRERLRQSGPASFADRSVAGLWLCYKHAGRRWAVALYWAQQVRARWLEARWRHDRDARRRIGETMVQATDIYRKLRAENRRPQLL